MNIIFKPEEKTQDELKQMWNKAIPAETEIQSSFIKDGKEVYHTISMLDGIVKTIDFYTKIELPPLPNVFVPDTVTSSIADTSSDSKS